MYIPVKLTGRRWTSCHGNKFPGCKVYRLAQPIFQPVKGTSLTQHTARQPQMSHTLHLCHFDLRAHWKHPSKGIPAEFNSLVNGNSQLPQLAEGVLWPSYHCYILKMSHCVRQPLCEKMFLAAFITGSSCWQIYLRGMSFFFFFLCLLRSFLWCSGGWGWSSLWGSLTSKEAEPTTPGKSYLCTE